MYSWLLAERLLFHVGSNLQAPLSLKQAGLKKKKKRQGRRRRKRRRRIRRKGRKEEKRKKKDTAIRILKRKHNCTRPHDRGKKTFQLGFKGS